MAEKDLVQRTLESYEDVFADIVNVLIWNGERKVLEKDLHDADPVSTYKADKKVRWQGRDVCKYWKNNEVRIAFCGFENQTLPDADMPLRVIGYDGASYRAQLKGKERYPVITLVLYFGRKHWKKNTRLHERIGISDELKPFVNDYKVNIIEVSYLSDKQISMFHSDFRFLADMMVQKRKNKNYEPPKGQIKHTEAVLDAISVFSGDSRYRELINEDFDTEGVNMCEIYDSIEKKGIKEGIKEGRLEMCEENIRKLMKNASLSVDEAMNLLGIKGKTRTTMKKAIQG